MSNSNVKDLIIAEIRKVFDPEIPVNVYDIGLIYEIAIEGREAKIEMTLTSPNCPVAESLPISVKDAAESAEGIDRAEVEVVWDPPWGPHLLSEAAQLELGMY